jgi:hypothetical protein
VVVSGSVSENMPPPISQQGEWLKKLGWMPRRTGTQRIGTTETPRLIPSVHVPEMFRPTSTSPYRNVPYVPNLIVTYDPTLATGRTGGVLTGGFQYTNAGVLNNLAGEFVRQDFLGRPLPPMPRLPVSPSLAYFGEVNP